MKSAGKAFGDGCAFPNARRQHRRSLRRVKDAGFARAAWRLIFRTKNQSLTRRIDHARSKTGFASTACGKAAPSFFF
jgi:hypothetical protein